jgi:predicted transcriptional regulator of viral defense system
MRAMADFTSDQWGMITSAQAKVIGVGGSTMLRAVEAGLLERVTSSCYLATAASYPQHLHAKAVWLRLNPAVPGWDRPNLDPDGGVISHSSAALIHDIGDLRADIVEVTVPRRRTTREQDVRLRRGDLTEDDITIIDGLPVTTVPRTILDQMADHTDGSHVGTMIQHAALRGLVDLDQLANQAQEYACRYGVRRGDGHDLIEYLLTQIGQPVVNYTTPDQLTDFTT